jgi:hypothetical protein
MAESIVTELALYPEDNYTYTAIFGTTQVVLEFFFNARSKSWHLDISDSTFNYLVRGLKLLPGVVHGADFSLEPYGIKGYLVLIPVTPNLKYEDIQPEGIYQYYKLFYIEEV